MSSSSQQNSAPRPVPNNNDAEPPLPWAWRCKRMVDFWSDPNIFPSTVRWESCDKVNEGVDVCQMCNRFIEVAEYEVVHQTRPPPPPPLTRQRNSRRGPAPR
ncbi:uncharacterized protein Bfra_004873 [Botrytis fragariae]|uniref:Uncharacterized protein n=1 Tax=Botrytis fragariae TaxID=1964551 RepID=A0A8H6ATB6_9HELO|nr:uncharacterized protein Bfra_004873 [Botrytis fragariae]KAF5873413.1 hypothetical protein Bfra_004873 [Botrytis fragariae]